MKKIHSRIRPGKSRVALSAARIVVLFVLSLQLLGGLTLPLLGRSEVFPLFTWALFPEVPNRPLYFRVRIETKAEDGSTRMVDFFAPDSPVDHRHSITAHMLIQKLGFAAAARNAQRTISLARDRGGHRRSHRAFLRK
jgi:hypothetical protein